MQTARAWNMSVLPYAAAQRVTVAKNCFAMMFTNLGDTIATINGATLFPSATPTLSAGDSISIGAHVLDLYKGKVVIAFLPPIGVAPKVEVTQLFYLEGTGLTDNL